MNTGDLATSVTHAAVVQMSLATSTALLAAPMMQTRFPEKASGAR